MAVRRSLSFDETEPDEQRIQRLDARTAAVVERFNLEHRQRADAATSFTDAWTDLSAWRASANVNAGSGRLYAGGSGTGIGVVRDINLAPGQTGIFRCEIYASGASGQQVVLGVSNAALGSAPVTPDQNGVYIGVNGGNSTIFVGNQLGTTGNQASANTGAVANGYYLLTVVVDPTHISLVAQGYSDNKGWLAARIPRTNMPGGTGQINCVSVGVYGSSGPSTANTTVGPISGVIGDHQPPSYTEQRTVGGKALWDSAKPTILFRTSPTTGIRWAIRIPGSYSPLTPSPVICYMHGANGNVMTPYDGGSTTLMDNVADPGNMILASSDNGPSNDMDSAGRPAGSADYTELVEWIRRYYATAGVHLLGVSGGAYQLFNMMAERVLGGVQSAISAAGATDLQATAADPAFQTLVYNAWGASSPSTLAAAAKGRDPALHAPRQYRGIPVLFTHYASDPTVNVATHTTAMKARIDAWGAADTLENVVAGSGHVGSALYGAGTLTWLQKYDGAIARAASVAGRPYSPANPPPSGGGSPTGPAGGDLAGTYPNPTILKDQAAATASMRTLGTGATQAAAGNDSRLSDARTPTAHTHTKSQITDFAHGHASSEISDPTYTTVAQAISTLDSAVSNRLLRANNLSDLPSAVDARSNLGLGSAATRTAPASGNAAAAETVLGSDTRLSDARNPTAHTHTKSQITDFAHTHTLGEVTTTATDGMVPVASSGLLVPRWLQLDDMPEAWVKRTCQVMSASNVTLSGIQTIDGIAGAAGMRVLLGGQSTAANNGIWIMQSGSWTRPLDFNNADDAAAAMVSIEQGTQYGGTRWSTNFKFTDTFGTTGMAWARMYDGFVADTMPGSEMAYVERTANFTTTNTTALAVTTGASGGSAAQVASLITPTITGEGRAVDIEFEGSFQHSVSSSGTVFVSAAAWIIASVNGAAIQASTAPAGYLAGTSLGLVSTTRKLNIKRRFVLVAGTTYQFSIGISSNTSGTLTLAGTSTIPHWLSVTRR